MKGFGARREKSAETVELHVEEEPKPGSAEAALAAGGARVLDAVAVADVRRADPKARCSRKVGSLEGLHSLLSSLSSAGLQTSQVRGDAGEARERSEAEMLRRGIEEHACVEGGAPLRAGRSRRRRRTMKIQGCGERGMVTVKVVEEGREGTAVGESEEQIRRGLEEKDARTVLKAVVLERATCES